MMKGILSVIAMVMVFSAIAILPSASAQSSYGPSWEEHCSDGQCTRTLYSGIMFGYEDSSWKPIDELRSFVGTTDIKCVVKRDNETDPDVECLDYNYTSVKLKINDSKKYKLKIYDGENKTKIKLDKPDKVEDYFLVDSLINYSFGDVIHIGENSTTITLQEAGTENLEDASVDSDLPDSNINTDQLSFHTTRNNLIKFNLTSIPAGVYVTSAEVSLLVEANYIDTSTEGFNITFALIYQNYTCDGAEWVETCVTWNKRPLNGTVYDNETRTNTKLVNNETSGWDSWDVMDFVSSHLSDSYLNISFYGYAHDGFGGLGGADSLVHYSKEESTVASRPKLEITYVTGPEVEIFYPENTTYTGTGQWLNFTYTANTEACWYDYNGANTTITGCANTSFTAVEGLSTITLWANDSSGTENSSSITFTTNTTMPTYDEPSYLPTVEEPNPNPITIAIYNASYCNIDIDGTNYSMTVSGGNCSYSFTKSVSATETIYFTIYMNNSVGNSNSTSQYSFTMTNAGAAGGEAGGGGSSFIVYGPDCGDYRATPADFSGASEPGTEMGMFILKIRNGADEQSFDATLSDNLRSFCGFDGDTHLELLPNMEGEFRFQCEAPNGTISGYLEFRSSTGCVDSRPVVISGGLGTWADISYSVMLLGVGDIGGLFNSVELPYLGFDVPFGALVIVVILIIVGVLVWIQNQ